MKKTSGSHLSGAASQSTPGPKAVKRANIFSKSRDTHESRGTRQMKTASNPQSFARGR